MDSYNHDFNLQTVSRDIVQISHEITPRFAGVSQREGSARDPVRPVCSLRDRGERAAESGPRVRETINKPDGRRGVEQGWMAQRFGEDRRPRGEIDRQGGR